MTDTTGEGESVGALREEVARLRAEIAVLEAAQVDRWSEYVGETRAEILAHRDMVTEIKNTFSWRVTEPLRRVRGLVRRGL